MTPQTNKLSAELSAKLARLQSLVAEMKRAVVAFSGGVDSSLMLKVAVDVLGTNATGVLAASPSLPRQEKEDAILLARNIGAELEIIETSEVEDVNYAANAPNRCFFCKDYVYAALSTYAESQNVPYVLDGMNAEDTLDIRPGRAAAIKHAVRSPLNELGFSKQDVRDAALSLGLTNWNKPAAACLSSRIPYGTKVTSDLLGRIEAAEMYLKSLGFDELRVRHHGDIARIEVPETSFVKAISKQKELTGGLKALGWLYITLDLEGIRQGSMNETLKRDKRASV